ncbi:MAG TPA: biotin/lipoyl-containing protein [Gemmatimonadales bacterium]
MKYYVEVRGRQITVEVDGDRVVVDGVSGHASIRAVPGTPIRMLTVEGRQRALAITLIGNGRWALASGGERCEIEVVDERTRHIRSLAAASGRQVTGGVLKAPMPGLVVRLEVEPGQLVAPGGGVLVLEAMKMENELRSPAGGRVRAVLVRAGQAVEKGQALVEFEAG